MEQGSKEVKSGGKIVGNASFAVCETLEECIATHGESNCVKLINTQFATNTVNEIRRQATEGDKVRLKDAKKLLELVPSEKIPELIAAIDEGDMETVGRLIAEARSEEGEES